MASIRRRRSLASILASPSGAWASLLVVALASPPVAPLAARAGASNPSRLVDVFAGTEARTIDFGTGGGAGNTFPGATAPFGMVQWSPDTIPSVINSPGGYSYEDTEIRGFSLTHLSGAGCAVLQDVPFLPTTAPVATSPAVAGSYDIESQYTPAFDHRHERAAPGYYRVVLDHGTSDAIRVELTATTRSGFGRFVYPSGATATMLINAGGSAMANGDAVFAIDPSQQEVSGWVESGQFCYARDRYRVYFAARFSRPFDAFGTWTKQTLSPGSTAASDHSDNPFQLRPLSGLPNPSHNSTGAQAGAYVSFDTTGGRRIEVRVGLSFVSVENARANLAAETDGLRFRRARGQARSTWNEALSAIRVRGGRRSDLRTFYTALYHAMLAPNVLSDVDGSYPGMDGAAHTTGDGSTHYGNFSGWDVYRSQIPLLAVLFPERASDMVRSVVRGADESGWLAKWSVVAGHTNVMVGDPADAIIAGAYAFGARDFDADAALAAMLHGATVEGVSANADYVERAGLDDYLTLGYVGHEGTETSSGASTSLFGDAGAVWGSAATTLEYSIADFAIARLAAARGEATTCQIFLQRAASWQNLFNPVRSSIEPRLSTGDFLATFDPASKEGFVEGSGAQYLWLVPHDLAGLADALGGTTQATARLDDFFTELNAGPDSVHAYLGNEPNAHAPWIYDWLGMPAKTQAVVRSAMLSLFGDGADGYPGNDDLGQMSAWYVWAALGMYPSMPGTDVLALSAPLFGKAIVRTGSGRLEIRAGGAGAASPYVSSLRVDGAVHDAPWLSFSDLSGDHVLDYALAGEASSWGTAPGGAPPSYPSDSPIACTLDGLPN